jgi:hypothetical protein
MTERDWFAVVCRLETETFRLTSTRETVAQEATRIYQKYIGVPGEPVPLQVVLPPRLASDVEKDLVLPGADLFAPAVEEVMKRLRANYLASLRNAFCTVAVGGSLFVNERWSMPDFVFRQFLTDFCQASDDSFVRPFLKSILSLSLMECVCVCVCVWCRVAVVCR